MGLVSMREWGRPTDIIAVKSALGGKVMFLGYWMLLVLLVFAPASGITAPSRCTSLPFVEEKLSKDERIEALMQRGAVCVRERNMAQVIATFSEVIGLDPNNIDAYINRGSAYVRSGLVELGLADFSHIIRKHPAVVQAWYNRGTAFLAAEQYDAAIVDLSETIRLKPEFARAYCNRGLARLRKSDYEGALSDFEQGLKEDARMPVCYFARGETRYKEGEYEEAVEDLTKGLEFSPAPQGYEMRARAFERLGMSDKALSDYEAALKMAPNYKSAQKGLERLSQKKD
jgi:tetratricopeptide (TPR) repeat protein